MVGLPDSEKILKISLVDLTECMNVMDGLTDRHTDGQRMMAWAVLDDSIARQKPSFWHKIPNFFTSTIFSLVAPLCGPCSHIYFSGSLKI